MDIANTSTLSRWTDQILCFSVFSIHANFQHQSIFLLISVLLVMPCVGFWRLAPAAFMRWLSKQGPNHKFGPCEVAVGSECFWKTNSSTVAHACWNAARVSETLGKTFAPMISYQLMTYFFSFFCCVGCFLCAPHQIFCHTATVSRWRHPNVMKGWGK